MIEEYIPIAHLKPDTTYSEVFLVRDVSVKNTRKGKDAYLSLTLIDVTGSIEGVVWNYSNADIVRPGQYIALEITTKIYKDKLQFNAKGTTLQPFNGIPNNIQDYIAGPAAGILDFYADELKNSIDEVDDPDYRDILLHSVDLVDSLRNAPFGQTGPLAHPGGLLIHAVYTIRLARQAEIQGRDIDGLKINKSLLILGSIIRNIGWSTTTTLEGNFFRQRDAFFMTGVYRASARFIDHLILSTESSLGKSIPESKKQALHNLCNSIEDIQTLEGKTIAWAGELAGVMHLASYSMRRKQAGSWCGDFFVGHHDN